MKDIDRDIDKEYGNSYKNRANPKQNCLDTALMNRFKVLALQDGGQCFGDDNLDLYKKYGKSTECISDKGGPLANSVYEIETGNCFILLSHYLLKINCRIVYYLI